MSDRAIVVESNLERKAALVLLAHPLVADLREQIGAVPYVNDSGQQAKHTFDFLVLQHDGMRVAVAVRPAQRAEKLRHQLMSVRRHAPDDFADRVLIMTERHCTKIRVFNAVVIHKARRVCRPDAIAAMRSLVGGLAGEASVASLMNASGLGPISFDAIACLIGEGVLHHSQETRLSSDTLVWRPTREGKI